MFGKRKNTKELPESPFCYKEDGTTLNLRFDIGQNLNKAFVGLGSCDNVQAERSIFEYANWPKLRT